MSDPAFRIRTVSAFGPLEQRIMDVLWDAPGWVAVGDVVAALGSGSPSYSAVKAVLANLVEKGHVRKREGGRAKHYSATRPRAAVEEAFVRGVIGPLLREHRNPLFAHLVDEMLDDGSVTEFERLIAERRAQRERDS